jgi:hypothetical protein
MRYGIEFWGSSDEAARKSVFVAQEKVLRCALQTSDAGRRRSLFLVVFILLPMFSI